MNSVPEMSERTEPTRNVTPPSPLTQIARTGLPAASRRTTAGTGGGDDGKDKGASLWHFGRLSVGTTRLKGCGTGIRVDHSACPLDLARTGSKNHGLGRRALTEKWRCGHRDQPHRLPGFHVRGFAGLQAGPGAQGAVHGQAGGV